MRPLRLDQALLYCLNAPFKKSGTDEHVPLNLPFWCSKLNQIKCNAKDSIGAHISFQVTHQSKRDCRRISCLFLKIQIASFLIFQKAFSYFLGHSNIKTYKGISVIDQCESNVISTPLRKQFTNWNSKNMVLWCPKVWLGTFLMVSQ